MSLRRLADLRPDDATILDDPRYEVSFKEPQPSIEDHDVRELAHLMATSPERFTILDDRELYTSRFSRPAVVLDDSPLTEEKLKALYEEAKRRNILDGEPDLFEMAAQKVKETLENSKKSGVLATLEDLNDIARQSMKEWREKRGR